MHLLLEGNIDGMMNIYTYVNVWMDDWIGGWKEVKRKS
jgi:hypothetical protein